jgi:UPF0716 family protein affecting phage T7 exclusion
MVARVPISSRVLRAGAILLAGWMVLEIVLMQLVAARIGWGATLVLLSLKGGLGLLVLGVMTTRGLRRLKSGIGLAAGPQRFRMLFGVASGILITLPGLIPPLIGVALFTPSLQDRVLRRFGRGAPMPAQAREIDLSGNEWREIRRKKRATKAPVRKASLEAKPPSV